MEIIRVLVWLNARMVPITWDKYKCTTLFEFSLDCPYLNISGVMVQIDIIKMDSESTCTNPKLTLCRKMTHHEALFLHRLLDPLLCNTYSTVVLKSTVN